MLDVGPKVKRADYMPVWVHHSLYLLFYTLNIMSDLLNLFLCLLERASIHLGDSLELAHEYVLGLLKHFDSVDLFQGHGLAGLCDLPLEVECGPHRLMHHVFSHLGCVLCVHEARL